MPPLAFQQNPNPAFLEFLDGANIEAVKNKRCSGCKCRTLKRCTADESIAKPIMPPAIIEPEGLNPIGNNEWEEIEFAVDWRN